MENSAAPNIFFKHIFSRVGRSEGVIKAMWPSANGRDLSQGQPGVILGSIWWSSQECTTAGAVVRRQAWQTRGFAHVRQIGIGDLLLFISSLSMLRWKKKKVIRAIFTQQCVMSSGVFFGTGQNSYKTVTIIWLTSSQKVPHKKLKMKVYTSSEGKTFTDQGQILCTCGWYFIML